MPFEFDLGLVNEPNKVKSEFQFDLELTKPTDIPSVSFIAPTAFAKKSMRDFTHIISPGVEKQIRAKQSTEGIPVTQKYQFRNVPIGNKQVIFEQKKVALKEIESAPTVIPETVASLATGFAAFIPGFTTELVSLPFGGGEERREKVQTTLTYQPKTETAQKLVETFGTGLGATFIPAQKLRESINPKHPFWRSLVGLTTETATLVLMDITGNYLGKSLTPKEIYPIVKNIQSKMDVVPTPEAKVNILKEELPKIVIEDRRRVKPTTEEVSHVRRDIPPEYPSAQRQILTPTELLRKEATEKLAGLQREAEQQRTAQILPEGPKVSPPPPSDLEIAGQPRRAPVDLFNQFRAWIADTKRKPLTPDEANAYLETIKNIPHPASQKFIQLVERYRANPFETNAVLLHRTINNLKDTLQKLLKPLGEEVANVGFLASEIAYREKLSTITLDFAGLQSFYERIVENFKKRKIEMTPKVEKAVENKLKATFPDIPDPLGYLKSSSIEKEEIRSSISPETRKIIEVSPNEGYRAWRRFKEFWSPLSTLPQKEKLLSQRAESMGGIARTERIVDKLITRTKTLSDQQKAEIFEAMDGRRNIEDLPVESAKIAKEFISLNNIIGKMLVKRDLISEKVYQQHKGQYIKYVYLKHVLGEGTDIPINPNGKINTNVLKARKDLTTEQRKAIGWIEDVSVAEPLGVAQSLSNVVKYDYLEKLSEDPRNVWTPSIVNIADIPRKYSQSIAKAQATRLSRITGDNHVAYRISEDNWGIKNVQTDEKLGMRMGIGELVKEVDLYRKMKKENPNSPEISQRLEIYERHLTQAQEATKNVPKDFIQMPSAKSWGPLAGTFLRKEIARDLMSFYGGERGNIEGLSKAVNIISQIDEKATGIFKVGKVPLNLPTVVRNTVSNLIQLHMSGMHPWEIPQYVIKAGEAMIRKTPDYQQAFREGLFKTNWSVTEINEVIDQFKSLQGGTMADIVGVARNLAKYYGRIDDLFKTAKFLEQRAKGIDIPKAAIEANKWGMDYSLADPSIKWARKHFIPFVSFSFKIAPLVAETAIKRPWVLGEYMAAPYLIHAAIKHLYKGQMTEKDWEELQRTIPQEVTKRQSFTLVPWKINGKWHWFDYSYFLPWGNYIQAWSGLKEGDIKSPFAQFGIGGTPMLTLLKTFTSATLRKEPPRDSFSGMPIYNRLDDPLTKSLKTSEYFYNQFAPSMLTRFGALGYILNIGKEDRYGRTISGQQAIGKLFGINLQVADPRLAAIVRKAKINALKDEYIRINLDPNLSSDQKKKYAKRFQKEIMAIMGTQPAAINGEIRQSYP